MTNKSRLIRTTPVLTLPPKQWVRLYGTRLELYNEFEEPKQITADLAGVHLAGIRMRLCDSIRDVAWVYINHEEVKQDDSSSRR